MYVWIILKGFKNQLIFCVTVINVENIIGMMSSNHVCVSIHVNAHRRGMNPFSPALST